MWISLSCYREKIIVLAGILFALPFFVFSSTDVPSIITENATWTKVESPYIVRHNAAVDDGITLAIEPGVVVKFADTAGYLVVKGILQAGEIGKEPVIFTSYADDEAGGDTNGDGSLTAPAAGDWRGIAFESASSLNALTNVIVRYGGGSNIVCMVCVMGPEANLTITKSVITASERWGIYVSDGHVSISDSSIENNTVGIEISNSNIGRVVPQAVMHNSIIRGNTLFGIRHTSFYETPDTDARHNWWGDASGPYHLFTNPTGLGNAVSDHVLFEPWLAEEPDLDMPPPAPPPAECCSNIAFIPGLQATRLELDDNRLWEPNRNLDVQTLYLDDDGNPVTADIYTNGIIDEAFGFNIYKNFIAFMDELVATSTIEKWQPFPYDWRDNAEDIVESDIQLSDGTTYRMADELLRLAEDSPTGKVIVIAHSNGGLVAKALISKLEEEGKANLIDKLILVASPQLGTPKAIASMLHGDEQTIPPKIGILLTKETARELAENMPSAYTLLPSKKYFSEVFQPVIEFDADVAETYDFPALYSNAIETREELDAFLLGDNGIRMEPASFNTDEPNVLGENLLREATSTQDALDAWTAPAGIRVIQIAGWGLDTIRGIRYDDCDIPLCPQTLSHLDRKLLLVHDGDGTVVIPSAAAMEGERYYVNLKNHNKENLRARRNRDHADILEVKPLQDFIEYLVKNENILPEHITEAKPTPQDTDKTLRFRIHSPVSLDLYDTEGNHTGLIQNPNPDSDLQGIEQQIPNSYYLEFGETKYAGADTFATTTIVLVGQGTGTFTLEIDEVLGDSVTASTSFVDIPVLEGTNISTEVQRVASSTVLSMDMDNDGITDVVIQPGEGVTIDELLDILRGMVRALELPKNKEAKFIKAIDKLEKTLAKEYKNEKTEKMKTKNAFLQLERLIERFTKKHLLTSDDSQELLYIIGQVKNGVVG